MRRCGTFPQRERRVAVARYAGLKGARTADLADAVFIDTSPQVE